MTMDRKTFRNSELIQSMTSGHKGMPDLSPTPTSRNQGLKLSSLAKAREQKKMMNSQIGKLDMSTDSDVSSNVNNSSSFIGLKSRNMFRKNSNSSASVIYKSVDISH